MDFVEGQIHPVLPLPAHIAFRIRVAVGFPGKFTSPPSSCLNAIPAANLNFFLIVLNFSFSPCRLIPSSAFRWSPSNPYSFPRVSISRKLFAAEKKRKRCTSNNPIGARFSSGSKSHRPTLSD